MIIAKCSQMTSMLMATNRNAAVIIGSQRRDHEFVIIALSYSYAQRQFQLSTTQLLKLNFLSSILNLFVA